MIFTTTQTVHSVSNKTMDDKHVHFHQENVYGDKYDIHDNPGATFNFGGSKKNANEDEELRTKTEDKNKKEDDNDIVLEELTPFFYGDEAEAKHFMQIIKGMKGQDITQLVNRLLREKKVSDLTCLKPLWTVLNSHGLYKNAYSTWAANIDR